MDAHPGHWLFIAGRRHAVVAMPNPPRVAIRLSGCASDEEASLRARILTRVVTLLTKAGFSDDDIRSACGARLLLEAIGAANPLGVAVAVCAAESLARERR